MAYTVGMQVLETERLARTGDMSLEACALRLRAARHYTGLSQIDVCRQIGVKKTTYNNMEQALSFPSREVMRWFYRTFRLDFNFLMNGDFAQLPADMHEQLFAALQVASSEWDRKSS